MSQPELVVADCELALVREILRTLVPGACVWIYGSRARGTTKRFADLDIAIDDGKPLGLNVLGALREAFDDSALAYKVDVTDLQRAEPAFVASIARDWVAIRQQ